MAIRAKYRRYYLAVFLSFLLLFFFLMMSRGPSFDIEKALAADIAHPDDLSSLKVEEYVDLNWVVSVAEADEPRHLPEVKVKGINCAKLFNGNRPEHIRATKLMSKPSKRHSDDDLSDYLNLKCSDFVRRRNYVTVTQSEEEAAFPLAFSITMHKDVAQFERLFRTIYRPEHVYCIHIDANAAKDVFDAVTKIASCFPANVVVLTDRLPVLWGTVSVLDVELMCMRTLLQRFGRWKYYINLTGQEWPLRTMLELVRVLRALKGANSVEGTVERLNLQDFREPLMWHITNQRVLLVKGSLHVVVQRGFVEYALRNDTAIRLLKYMRRNAGYPEEKFFATLNHNPQLGVPGAYKGRPETHPTIYPFIARLKNWLSYPFDYPCRSGNVVRQICIWGVADLPFIVKRNELFANKFYYDTEYFALDCLEELYWNRTRADYSPYRRGRTGDPQFLLEYYKNLDFVKNHV